MPIAFSRYASLFLLAVGQACAGGASHDPPSGASPGAAAFIAPDGVPLDIEQAERDVDLNRDVAAARALLTNRLASGTLSSDSRDDATFALARASHELGEDEAAIASLEGLLAQHAGDARWPLEDESAKMLRDLLVHGDVPPVGMFEQAVVAPVAHALIGYLPDVAKGAVHADVVTIGGGDATSSRLGTFNVAGALHAERVDHCASCGPVDGDEVSTAHAADWTGLAAFQSHLPNALVVVYFTLEDRIPARYDDALAIPSSEIAIRLQRGEAFAVARERPGAPPVVLIAAPATSQLRAVEEALAAQSTLPLTPLDVKVPDGIDPTEIQHAVRDEFGRFRSCYMGLLTRSPAAEGRVTASFIIEAGHARTLRVDLDPALREAEFQTCMIAAFTALTFPTRPGSVSVIYPISFSPNPR